MTLLDRVADRILARAKKTPYTHIGDYMERYWVVPTASAGSASEIGVGPVPFFRRPFAWCLQKLGIAARVHIIKKSDDDRAFHDHPWPYLTIILKGGYTEVKPLWDESGIYQGETRRYYGAGSILIRPARSWHRLEIDAGQSATTLFVTGRYKQRWGFLDRPNSKVYWREWLNDHSTDTASNRKPAA